MPWNIWQKYIFKELIKCFVFFLFCFFLLYSLIDFSTNAQDFIKNGQFYFTKALIYYGHQFFKRLELLLPLALLISTIKVLSSLNANRELLALQACGVRIKKILIPFWVLATLCTVTGYINEEVLTPRSASYLAEVKQARAQNPLKKLKQKQFTILYLADSSKLVYQKFDKEKNVFFDVYWIRSFNDIWRIKYLSADPQKTLAQYVDHITRNEEGFLEKKESYEQCLLPALKWKTSELKKKQSSIKHQKISNLISLFLKKDQESFHAQGELLTYFSYKLLMPLLPFLILLGILPRCIGYSRNPPLFLLYGISIFCFIVFCTLVDSMIIIGENQIIHPFIAIGAPFLLVFLGSFWSFRSIK